MSRSPEKTPDPAEPTIAGILSRRQALQGAALGLGGLFAARPALGAAFVPPLTGPARGPFGGLAAACGLTPPQTEGPFYPVQDQPDKDADLTQVQGRPGRALGQVIYILGAVTDEACRPVPGALVEIWQACASGRYNHPGDADSPRPLDPNFQYWGRVVTDAQGRYSFKTIVPGHYPAGPGWVRPPHVHYKVHRRGFHELTTQMYFEGHPLNPQDKILEAIPPMERARVIVPMRAPLSGMEPDAKHLVFNLSLRGVS